jgi:TonB family protein
MKTCFCLLVVLALAVSVSPQSGRRAREIALPLPPPVAPTTPSLKIGDTPPAVTRELEQNYRCTEDGTLELILNEESAPKAFSARDVDARVTIVSRPTPTYTKEARRNGVQGFVVLRALLSAAARVERLKVMKRLPAGLTEKAIRAACKIKFKPAMKNGQAVSQLVTIEYVFRLAHSSIFGP